MQIKIYRYHGGKPREVASGLVELSYPPRITECRPLSGDDAPIIDEIRGYIELILKNDLIPGRRGPAGTLEHYKPPVGEPLAQINGVDYSWTIEETTFDAAQERIERISGGKPVIKTGVTGQERKRILVVDDDEDVVKALKIRLRSNGYDVFSASDPIQGVSMVRKENPDLIILDIRMPAGGGFSLVERLRHARAVPIIILTGSSETAHQSKARELGIQYYMKKPYDPEKLLDVVRKALETGP